MVSSIGSVAGGLFQQYQEMQSSSELYSTKQGQSFEELIGNGKITAEGESTGTGVTSMGGASESKSESEKEKQYSEMDLNKDGQVTIDEVVKYMQVQNAQKMSEQMSSEEGSNEMNQQTQKITSLEDYKNQQASKAYASSQSVMDSVTDMISMSFAV